MSGVQVAQILEGLYGVVASAPALDEFAGLLQPVALLADAAIVPAAQLMAIIGDGDLAFLTGC